MTEIFAELAEYPLIAFIAAIVTLVGLIVGVHYTLANIRKTNAESFQKYWERIDKLEQWKAQNETALDEAYSVIDALKRYIGILEDRMRQAHIPIPPRDGVTEPLPRYRGLSRRQ